MRRTRALYARALGFVALVAVGSFWTQLSALSGARGLVPAAGTIAARRAESQGFFEAPTWLWFSSSDAALHATAALALLAATGLALGKAPRPLLLLLWASWLSLVTACGPWLWFQWDTLLVECALVSVPFALPGWRPARAQTPAAEVSGIGAANSAAKATAPISPLAVFLLRCLACKLAFGDAAVKLLSTDPAWRDLSALTFHFWTQPLPSWTSPLLAALPREAHEGLCAAYLALGATLPLLQWGPRPLRLSAALGYAFVQLAWFASGNTSTSHLLALVLVLPMLDDDALAALAARLPRRWRHERAREAEPTVGPWRAPAVAAAALIAVLDCGALLERLGATTVLSPVLRRMNPWLSLGAYGGFGTMTKERREVIVEGSDDGERWRAYELPVKPGRVDRRPPWVAPWQPRLDWQLWFAALTRCDDQPWVPRLQAMLVAGHAGALALFSENPFPERPPRFVRTVLYDYRFAPLGAHGRWWERAFVGPYCPVTSADAR